MPLTTVRVVSAVRVMMTLPAAHSPIDWRVGATWSMVRTCGSSRPPVILPYIPRPTSRVMYPGAVAAWAAGAMAGDDDASTRVSPLVATRLSRSNRTADFMFPPNPVLSSTVMANQ